MTEKQTKNLSISQGISLAFAQYRKSNFKEADALLNQFYAFDNTNVLLHAGLGALQVKYYKFAQKFFLKAIKIDPKISQAHSYLGITYHEMGRLGGALASFEKCLTLNPSDSSAHNNIANVFKQAGQIKKAISYSKRAIAIKPEVAAYHNNLAASYMKMDQYDPAIDHYHRALSLEGGNASIHYNLAMAFQQLRKRDQAVSSFKNVLKIEPAHPLAQAALLFQLRHLCDWGGIDLLEQQVMDYNKQAVLDRNSLSLKPFASILFCRTSEQLFDFAQAQSQQISQKILSDQTGYSFPSPQKDKAKLNIGYLSYDFYDHATAHLMAGLFEAHNREKFNICVFSYGPDDESIYRQNIEENCDDFYELAGLSHKEAADVIHKAAIDILIDLKGHTKNNRLEICAYRPAPIQVTYLGFPGTSGADFFDYIICDETVTPRRDQAFYSEKPLYLPHSYQVNNDRQKIAKIGFARSFLGLPETGFIFCSFNNNYKIDPPIFDLWMNLLKKTPKSVLWLYESSKTSAKNLKKEARARGVDCSRLVFAQKMKKDQHLARYRLADLALDTHICGGHTTTSDALWAGIPVLTMKGSHFPSRVASSLLLALDLPELIADDLQGYEALALDLAAKPAKLRALKKKLATQRLNQPLFDTPRFVQDLERAYDSIWNNYADKHKPSPIKV